MERKIWAVLIGANLLLVGWIAWKLVLPAHSKERPESTDTQALGYALALGTASRNFDTAENPLVSDGGPLSDKLLLRINGDPVGFYRGGLNVRKISTWLNPGENSITLNATPNIAVFAVVSRYWIDDESRQPKLVHKERLSPAAAQPPRIAFHVDTLPPVPARELLGDSADDRKQQEKEIRAALDRLIANIREHNGKAAADYLHEGSRLWLPAVFGSRTDSFKESLAFAITHFSDPNTTIVPEKRDVKFIFGRRAVLVYGEGTQQNDEHDNILTTQGSNRLLRLGPLVFAKVRGEWVVWSLE